MIRKAEIKKAAYLRPFLFRAKRNSLEIKQTVNPAFAHLVYVGKFLRGER
jgi:hypothetical protein